MTQQDLELMRERNEQRRKLKDQATPDLWEYDKGIVFIPAYDLGNGNIEDGTLICSLEYRTDSTVTEDGTFIAHARNDKVEDDVDLLLKAAEELLILKQMLSDLKVDESRAYELGKIEEREACATIAENWGGAEPNPHGRRAALAREIRNRGNNDTARTG